jgi:hypothetical protein
MRVHRGQHDFKPSVIKTLKHSEQNRLCAPEVKVVDQMENTNATVHHNPSGRDKTRKRNEFEPTRNNSR